MSLPVSPEYLEASLHDGFSQQNMKLVHHSIGELSLPTGTLVACDPFVDSDATPFSLNLPRGKFPVNLSIAEIATDQRVAFAVVRFTPAIPVRWQVLTTPGQNLSQLKDGEIFGYPVDSGTGSFMDRSAALLLGEATRKTPDYYETLIDDMEKTYRNTWSWLDVKFGEANLLAFSSGYGDGFYATYAGFDSVGGVAVVVTDFGVLPSESENVLPAASKRSPKKSGLGRLWDSLRGKS